MNTHCHFRNVKRYFFVFIDAQLSMVILFLLNNTRALGHFVFYLVYRNKSI